MNDVDFLLTEYRAGGRITGRNCRGDLSLGTTFTSLCRRVFSQNDGESAESPPLESVAEVRLQVMGIEAYRHSLTSLSSGLTGLLVLAGDGLDKVRGALSAAPERTVYSLCGEVEEHADGLSPGSGIV